MNHERAHAGRDSSLGDIQDGKPGRGPEKQEEKLVLCRVVGKLWSAGPNPARHLSVPLAYEPRMAFTFFDG